MRNTLYFFLTKKMLLFTVMLAAMFFFTLPVYASGTTTTIGAEETAGSSEEMSSTVVEEPTGEYIIIDDDSSLGVAISKKSDETEDGSTASGGTVSETESETETATGVLVKVYADNGIEFAEDDFFILVVEDEDGYTSPILIRAVAFQSWRYYYMDAGYYTVKSLEYMGDNTEIDEAGYACGHRFRADEEGESIVLTIGVGSTNVQAIQADDPSAVIGSHSDDYLGEVESYYSTQETTSVNDGSGYKEVGENVSEDSEEGSASVPVEYYTTNSIGEVLTNTAKDSLSTVLILLVIFLIGLLVIWWFHKKGKI